MPTYTYQCPACEAEFEREQKITDPPAEECETPACKGKPKRVISASTSFVLKGKGWYRDGY